MSDDEPAGDAPADDPATVDTAPEEHADDPSHGEEPATPFATDRTTAPQSPYTARDVAVGALVAAVGVAFTVVVPFLLA